MNDPERLVVDDIENHIGVISDSMGLYPVYKLVHTVNLKEQNRHRKHIVLEQSFKRPPQLSRAFSLGLPIQPIVPDQGDKNVAMLDTNHAGETLCDVAPDHKVLPYDRMEICWDANRPVAVS
jgi:hypothetical protein